LETFNESETAQIADNRFPVYYFYSLECPYCARIKPKIDELEAKYNSSVHFERHNVLLQDELEIYDNFTARYNVSSRVVPLVFVNDSYLSGMFEINDSLESLIIANTNISP
jgi:thiol-disulfide isomerase/thioredoxin